MDLFGIPQLHLWLRLEADPAAKQLCERPVVIPDTKRPKTVDFWVAGPGMNKYVLLAQGPAAATRSSEPLLPAFRAWATEVGCEVEEVQALANSPEQEMWYGNWTTILQQLSSFRPYLTSKLAEDVRNAVAHRIALSELILQLASEEPDFVRATVFELVHQGTLQYVDLRKERLSDLLQVEPS